MYCACGSLFSPRVTLEIQEQEEEKKRVTDGHGRSFGYWPWQKHRNTLRDKLSPVCHTKDVSSVVVEVSSGDAKRKQAATCTIHLGPPIFLQILDPL